ncbi:NS5-like protein [Shuangao insect virus 7]|uniref:NS5-like protein n=1 Tax=Shuangao insect virus 7 TaxID=1746063 RepID=UPI0007063D5C|nr:NS5-like protein [Shuangao insect virus 7]ALL52904.1 NS5-like protein [Shuangao insect virus 7]
MIIYIILVGIVGIILEILDRRGANRESPLEVLLRLSDIFAKPDVTRWGGEYKEALRGLGARAFNAFKNRGVRRVDKDPHVASRGYDKLLEISIAARVKPRGAVLSLCCGRGGWEQLYAASPDVTRITAVTLGKGPGHEGHEDFTDNYFPGREKVCLRFADATSYPITAHDTLLFDGGESHPDFSVEANRFNQLFAGAVMRQITPNTKTFILKILTPTSPETIRMMQAIQTMTGRGSLYRASVSRNSTLELYFVSTAPTNIRNQIRELMQDMARRGIENRKLEARRAGPQYLYAREEIQETCVPLLATPDMSDSIAGLGEPLPEVGRAYNHWESLGVYPMGVSGSKGMKYNKYGMACATRMLSSIDGFDQWKLTDTTPEGFVSVFNTKIDKPPTENHPYEKRLWAVYKGMSSHFQARGFRLRELSYDEIEKQVNNAGAPGYADMMEGVNDIKDYMSRPDWRKKVEKLRQALLSGRPKEAIFNTMGKREKKKSGGKGSRMIAYMSIGMRLLEMKLFGNLMKLTKPEYMHFGVGGFGLHDLGERLRRVWKGEGSSDDIAGFDTRVSAKTLAFEAAFVQELGGNTGHREMYEVYASPHILIPVPSPHRRVQLLVGRGQRMSGCQVTYPMNTLTRVALFLVQASLAEGVDENLVQAWVMRVMRGKEDIGGAVSGDDAVFTSSKKMKEIINHSDVLEDMGFPRKNMARGVRSPLMHDVREVEFCSHRYEPVTFMDTHTGKIVTKYMPTRDFGEIAAKSLIRTGGDVSDLDALAWISAQGNNLLVNYPHLRSARALGFAFKSVAPPNLVPDNKGGFMRPRPWMQPGDILTVFNDVHFGNSSKYPIPGFEVRAWRNVGYLKPKIETLYDPPSFTRRRSIWRDNLHRDVTKAIYDFGTGGNLIPLDLWRERRLD